MQLRSVSAFTPEHYFISKFIFEFYGFIIHLKYFCFQSWLHRESCKKQRAENEIRNKSSLVATLENDILKTNRAQHLRILKSKNSTYYIHTHANLRPTHIFEL